MNLFIASNWTNHKNEQLNLADIKNRLFSFFYVPKNRTDAELQYFFETGVFKDEENEKEVKSIERKSLKRKDISYKNLFDILYTHKSYNLIGGICEIITNKSLIKDLTIGIEEKIGQIGADSLIFNDLYLLPIIPCLKKDYEIGVGYNTSHAISERSSIVFVTAVVDEHSLVLKEAQRLKENGLNIKGIVCVVLDSEIKFIDIPLVSLFTTHELHIESLRNYKSGILG